MGQSCPQCGKSYTGAAIVTSAPDYLDNMLIDQATGHYTGWVVTHTLYCDMCNVLATRLQACNAAGGQRGEFLGSHGIRRDPRAINKHLRLHPQAAGVA